MRSECYLSRIQAIYINLDFRLCKNITSHEILGFMNSSLGLKSCRIIELQDPDDFLHLVVFPGHFYGKQQVHEAIPPHRLQADPATFSAGSYYWQKGRGFLYQPYKPQGDYRPQINYTSEEESWVIGEYLSCLDGFNSAYEDDVYYNFSLHKIRQLNHECLGTRPATKFHQLV